MKKLLFLSAILIAMTFVAMAADNVTGKWTYEMPAMGRGGPGGGGAPGGGGPGGGGGGTPRVATLDLKAEGSKLTGSVLQPAGRGGEPTPVAITNGKVDGNNVSFEVTRETQMGSMTTKYEGTVSGSEMKLKITSPGFNGGEPRVSEVTAKKS